MRAWTDKDFRQHKIYREIMGTRADEAMAANYERGRHEREREEQDRARRAQEREEQDRVRHEQKRRTLAAITLAPAPSPKVSSGPLVMSDELVERWHKIDAAFEREFSTPLESAVDKVNELLSGDHLPETKAKVKTKPSYASDSAFSLYEHLDPDVVTFFREFTVEMSLGCPPHKEEKFKDFTQECNIAVPSDFVLLPAGKTPKWNLSGSIKIKMPEDLQRMDIFDQIEPGFREKRVREFKNGKFARVVDTKLELALMVTDPVRFKITHYWKGPRKPKEQQS